MRHLAFAATVVLLLLPGCTPEAPAADGPAREAPLPAAARRARPASSVRPAPAPTAKRVEFSRFHPDFRFSAEIPSSWEAEYVPEIQAVSLYDPSQAADTVREQSRIFIRLFQASSFLTLQTVSVLSREPASVAGHEAVAYEIEKKANVPAFPHQPSWRNARHHLTDVRLSSRSPSLFYVFAAAPSLEERTVAAFLGSLRFHNDRSSLRPPLDNAARRVTKKPFDLEVAPGRSPVEPERFAGFHTGADFEILPGEEDAEVEVRAVCGGALKLKRTADGYGGVAVQDCLLEEPVTVVYGHLALRSIDAAVGTYLAPGDRLGLLGAGGSDDTDGERKHLHLSIRRGADAVLAGYVPRREQLSAWMDPQETMGIAPAP